MGIEQGSYESRRKRGRKRGRETTKGRLHATSYIQATQLHDYSYNDHKNLPPTTEGAGRRAVAGRAASGIFPIRCTPVSRVRIRKRGELPTHLL